MQKPILHRILGVVMIEHDRARNRIGTALMRSNELRERLATAALSGQHELALACPIIRHGEGAAHAGARRGGNGRDHLPDVLCQIRAEGLER